MSTRALSRLLLRGSSVNIVVRPFHNHKDDNHPRHSIAAKDGESAKDVMDRLGTWDARMEFPVQERSSIKRGTIIPDIRAASVGVCTHKGRREYQEDR